MTARAVPVVILLLVACATGEPSATSYTNVTAGVSSVTLASSSTGEVEATSETGAPEDDTTGEPTTTTADPPTTSGAPTSDTTTDPTAVDPTTSTTGETTGDDECGGCNEPPGPCHDPVGQCIVGECVYSLTEAGLACDDGDGCTEDDACDGVGGCEGTPVSCERPHATGGTCVDGACQGFQCTAPYDDCDGDMDNGCEVPVGVANQCDQGGLNPDNGCWTAYCGDLDDPNATNFGTYYCYDCANCNTPAAGMWRWCNHTTGNWYDAAMGTCPAASEDLACAP